MKSEEYLDRILEKVAQLKQEGLPLIDEAADKLVSTVRNGHRVYIFGCTHAGILTQEAFYRTGGLAIFNPIFAPGMTVDTTPITVTSELERVGGIGTVIARQSGMREGDLLLVHSASGRNSVPVDLAITAREMGVYVIVITALNYSKGVQSRHASGKRLFEVGDMVIDDLCPFGDSLVSLERSQVRVGPGSTVMGAVILNAIVAQAAAGFDSAGLTPPVYISANTDEGDCYNREVFRQYRQQIAYEMR